MGSLEGVNALARGSFNLLSEQNIVDCSGRLVLPSHELYNHIADNCALQHGSLCFTGHAHVYLAYRDIWKQWLCLWRY